MTASNAWRKSTKAVKSFLPGGQIFSKMWSVRFLCFQKVVTKVAESMTVKGYNLDRSSPSRFSVVEGSDVPY